MADSSLKAYRVCPTDSPKYHKINRAHSDITEPRKWNYSLFDCFSPGTLCITSCFLPCVIYGKTQSRVQDPSLESFSYVNRSCAIWSFLSLGALQCIAQTISRGEMRERHGIEGSRCGDCCVSFWCGCCALVQEEKEIELRTRPELIGYRKPLVMSMP